MFYQAMPQLADHLTTISTSLARSEQRALELRALIDRMARSQTTQLEQLQLLTSSSLTFQLEAPQLLSQS